MLNLLLSTVPQALIHRSIDHALILEQSCLDTTHRVVAVIEGKSVRCLVLKQPVSFGLQKLSDGGFVQPCQILALGQLSRHLVEFEADCLQGM
jgi:hypothetical protein